MHACMLAVACRDPDRPPRLGAHEMRLIEVSQVAAQPSPLEIAAETGLEEPRLMGPQVECVAMRLDLRPVARCLIVQVYGRKLVLIQQCSSMTEQVLGGKSGQQGGQSDLCKLQQSARDVGGAMRPGNNLENEAVHVVKSAYKGGHVVTQLQKGNKMGE